LAAGPELGAPKKPACTVGESGECCVGGEPIRCENISRGIAA